MTSSTRNERISMALPSVRPVKGGITAPQGFLAAGIHAGIKKAPTLDLALIVSEVDASVAGMFTTNRIVAAPVSLDRLHLRHGRARAILVNSGNANACTGTKGLNDAGAMAKSIAQKMNVPVCSVFVGSTGVIGQFLPISSITENIPRLINRLRRTGGHEAAKAIMTTDLRPKEVSLQASIGGRTVTIGGIAKGSGMIHPNMATMLAYLTTDAAIEKHALQRGLRQAVNQSFNCISVDGDTSTNDTILLLANGAAGNTPLRETSRHWPLFQRLLNQACLSLAMQVCRDGEGVTKIVDVVIEGAQTERQAKLAANAVATSCLVKTALFGEDANWGRILAAIGRSGARVDPRKIDLALGGIPIVKSGTSLGTLAENRIAKIVKQKEFTITADLHLGRASARVWTTDLSYDYVKINASYRS
jgi:glutamate N-acetyltransferase/amino-acid N-acetyltransferase